MRRIRVGTYDVHVGAGALADLAAVLDDVAAAHRPVVITDETVARHWGARVGQALPGADTLAIAPGEAQKTRETWARVTDEMLRRNFGRDTVVVAIGGGVVGDIAGFVAATYMRGVPVVQVPTTLLAMVDASVGGKTGVDTPAGKNLVGAFHQPEAVLIDPDLLRTLPAEHLRAGFAEIVKHGVVADAEYFHQAASVAGTWSAAQRSAVPGLTDLIARSVEIKAAIVTRDERESGLRKVLNFGHTIGHAVEAATQFETLHGYAVSIGLVTEAQLAERIGVAPTGTAREIERVCRDAGLPTSVPDVPVADLITFTRADKKSRGGRVEYALPARIGEMAGAHSGWAIPVDDALVREVLGG